MGRHQWEHPGGDKDVHPIAELPGMNEETTTQLHPWCQLGKRAQMKKKNVKTSLKCNTRMSI